MQTWLMHAGDFVRRGWRSMPWQDRLLVAVVLLIVGSSGCCTTPPEPMFPTCPIPSVPMIVEIGDGALNDAPATEEYLGRIENLCDALKEYD